MKKPQVTLLICTHNGSKTIKQALEAIANQKNIANEVYEIIVVDNASTDQTAQIASDIIQKLNLKARVLLEPRIGKINAFLKGLKEAQSEIISIIDDDNFIEPEFVRYTLEIFHKYPNVGIVCSANQIITDQPLSPWFFLVSGRYSCSKPSFENIEKIETDGTIISRNRFVAGAGSSFRSQILKDCLNKGYHFFNDAQRGQKMKVSCEDLEISCLVYSLGYHCGYHPSIQLLHAVQPERLNLDYFKVLLKTIGAGTLGIDPFLFTHKYKGDSFPIQWTWQWQLLSKLRRYLYYCYISSIDYLRKASEQQKFRNWLNRIECQGAIQRILDERGNYTRHIQQVASGDWTELRVR